MSDEIKIRHWIFCLIEDGEVYAYTQDEHIAKMFKKTRNMKKFFCKTMDLTRREYNELYKEYLTADLNMLKGATLNQNWKMVMIELPVTRSEEMEYQRVRSVYVNEYLCHYAMDVNPDAFKPKYLKALDMLRFTAFHEYIEGGNLEDFLEVSSLFVPDLFKSIVSQSRYFFIDEKKSGDG